MTLAEHTLQALKASLAAALPHRKVLRGVRMPGTAELDDAALRQGVFCIVASGMRDWQEHTNREGELGSLQFAIVFYGRLPADADDEDTERVEKLETEALAELLDWVQSVKGEPIDAVYPDTADFSQGLDAPVAWLVMRLRALYV